MMIHDVVDIARWQSLFPLDQLRVEARAKVIEERKRDAAAWLERAAHQESSYWWLEHRRERMVIDFAEATAGVLAERARDPEAWDRRRLERELSLAGPRPEHITSPYDLAIVEQLRSEMRAAIPVGQVVPTDVFVWSKGEPRRREVTKIGGLPYWPQDRPWPICRDGSPMQFIGQFCFADSLDIVGDLPGAVLTIFANPASDEMFTEGGSIYDFDSRGMYFAWVSLGVLDLICAEDIPAATGHWPIAPYFGAIHRTFDYPDLGPDGGDFGWDHPDWGGLGLIKATKIGGVPWWEQVDPKLPGRFLCTQESIQPAFGVPYPYLNMPDPIGPDFDEQYPRDDLSWGDAGRLYLHLDGEQICWEVQGG